MKYITILFLLYAASACSQSQKNKLTERLEVKSAGPGEQKTVTNSIGMEFISVPAGNFLMGAGEEVKDAYTSERPQHKVSISKPFLMGKHEVTQAQWEAVMGSNPYTLDRSNPYYNLPGMKQRITRPNHPATVS